MKEAIRKQIDFALAYTIDIDGNIWSDYTNKYLKCYKAKTGYVHAVLICNTKYKKTCKLHRLLAQSFIPNPENKPEVNHKDGIRDNNKLTNLEWCTRVENMQHSFKVLKRKSVGPTGSKASDESKRLMSIGKTGKNHPRFKGYYLYEGVQFASYKELGLYLKVYASTARKMHKRGQVDFIPVQRSSIR